MSERARPDAAETTNARAGVEALRRRPHDRPVVALLTGRSDPRWGRWCVLAEPRGWYRFDGRSSFHGDGPALPGAESWSQDLLTDLRSILRAGEAWGARRPDPPPGHLPFAGGWIGWIGYEAGRVIEPAASRRAAPPARSEPLVMLAWCPAACVLDLTTGRPRAVGEGGIEVDPDPVASASASFECGELRPSVDAATYRERVARVREYIAAGDIFQANLTRAWEATFRGSTRALAARAIETSGAWFGAYLEAPDGRTVLSMSPELFLRVDGSTREVLTRPIKGTRPAAAAAADLEASAKDAAELNMIVDLMRNDLGRVCDLGSVTVRNPRSIETHPTVHHGVAEIAGRLRDDADLAELVAATFPPGSITGAPKIRAMQIIEELEDEPRGVYCGAIGFFDARGHATLNVAIRTIELRGRRPPGRWDRLEGTLRYGAGAGIVADSDPHAEERETIDKTAVLRDVLAPSRGSSYAGVEAEAASASADTVAEARPR